MDRPVKKIPLHLTSKEVDTLLGGIKKERQKLGIALMAFGGLRVSEMCCLKVTDVNLARGFLKITGKGGKQRFVPLTSKLQSMIEKYLAGKGPTLTPESYLLGRTRVAWHYTVKKYSLSALGREDIHCHTLRHSFATALYEEGVQIEKISELLGHSRLETTMIYSHISMSQKREAIMVLDGPGSKIISFLKPLKTKKASLSVKNYTDIIGREKEINELETHIKNGISVVLFGKKGVGKSVILKQIKDTIYIDEFKKKQSLIKIILYPKNLEKDVYKETEKLLKKLSIDELMEEIKEVGRVVIIDDITDLSKSDRKTISKLSEKTVIAASTSRSSDKKLFNTFIEVKSLKRHHTRLILSEMIHMNNQRKKEALVDDILHTSGDNIKEAEYIANQLQLGKSSEEITTEERESNQVSIAPVLLICVLFFCAWVLKSYTTSMVAMGYAMLVVFRMVFMRFLFMPANRKRKV